MVDVGEPAPDFELPDATGRPVRLSAFRGKPVAVVFYCEDASPGCTAQTCSLRDHHDRIRKAGGVVLAIGPGDRASHASFAAAHRLPFPLLVDEDHRVARAYGSWGGKVMFGRRYEGQRRWTFLLDAGGVVRKIVKRPRIPRHGEEVLAHLAGADGKT